ncbi:MAG TPA: amidase [Methylomirabilota bacterium]|jgi:amidase
MSDRLGAFATATDMLAALRARRASAVELLELLRRRIERHNPELNAIVEPDFERARRDAEAADARRARGEDAPLLGLPMTLKESINVRGLRTTVGLSKFKEFRSAHDAPVTTRVKGAGAIVMAKTNVPPMLSDWQSVNPVYGRTNNPWDLGRTPGGSTGGGAAALAAGLTPLEFGSDIGGSIRVPAAFCGVYGHRPSETAMPRSGGFPIPPMPNAAVVMGVQGPMARSGDDLELALDVAAGPEVGEDVAWTIAIPPARRERLAGFRVAVLPSLDWVPVDAEVAAALDSVASSLGRLGCQVKVVQPDALGDHREHYALYLTLLAAVTSARVPAADRRARLDVMRTRDDEWSRASQRGIDSGAPDYVAWFGQREQYRAAWRAFFREWDVLLMPAFITPAYPHWDKPFPGTPESIRKTLDVNGTPVLEELGLFCASVATLSGQPSTAFPAGRTRGGLPIGLQAIGPYLEDRTPIRFASLVGRELGGFAPPPRYQGD